MRERLDVLDQRGLAVEPALRRERGATVERLLARDRGEQRRLLACDVGLRHLADADLDAVEQVCRGELIPRGLQSGANRVLAVGIAITTVPMPRSRAAARAPSSTRKGLDARR